MIVIYVCQVKLTTLNYNLVPLYNAIHNIDFDTTHSSFIFESKAKKRKCLVSGYPTDPNILGPTQTFLKTFRIL